jgi:hypothetical protein
VRELSLHFLDIAENSIAVGSKNIVISIEENSVSDLLKINVKDDGRGMDEATIKKVVDPFVTSRTTRKVGLGIPLLKEAAEACNGSLMITSKLGVGTDLEVRFQRSHIDRMPLGDVTSTFLNLLVANPAIHWLFIYRKDNLEFIFDDKEIKETLEDIPMTDPGVLQVIREIFETGISGLTTTNY